MAQISPSLPVKWFVERDRLAAVGGVWDDSRSNAYLLRVPELVLLGI